MWNEPLPLFPLNVVLFPGMPLPLRVFEDRYKTMINRCLEHQRPFGVVLIHEGKEVGPGAVPERVGTVARIRAVERLDEGRMNLFTEGAERFRLMDYLTAAEPYLVGIAEPLEDAPTESSELEPLCDEVRALFDEFFRLLLAYAGHQPPRYELPPDAPGLSFIIAAVMQGGPKECQALLEMTDTVARLEHERDALKREAERLRSAIENTQAETPRPLKEWKPDGTAFGSKN